MNKCVFFLFTHLDRMLVFHFLSGKARHFIFIKEETGINLFSDFPMVAEPALSWCRDFKWRVGKLHGAAPLCFSRPNS